MNYKEIVELLKLIENSNLSEFKVKDGEFELSIRTDKYNDQKAPKIVHSNGNAPMSATVYQPSAPAEAPRPAEAAISPSAPAKDDQSKYLQVKSPMVGTFYRSASPDKPVFLNIGDRVEVGSIVCIVEAMKLFNEIESEVKGTIVKIMVDDASPVEYDQVLFLVDPN